MLNNKLLIENLVKGIEKITSDRNVVSRLLNGKAFDVYSDDEYESNDDVLMKVRLNFHFMIGDFIFKFSKFKKKTTLRKLIVKYNYFTKEIFMTVIDTVEGRYSIMWSKDEGFKLIECFLNRENPLHYKGFELISDLLSSDMLVNQINDQLNTEDCIEYDKLMNMYNMINRYKELADNMMNESENDYRFIPSLTIGHTINNIVASIRDYKLSLQFEYKDKTIFIELYKHDYGYLPKIIVSNVLGYNVAAIPFEENSHIDIKTRLQVIDTRIDLVVDILKMTISLLESGLESVDGYAFLDKSEEEVIEDDKNIFNGIHKKCSNFNIELARLGDRNNALEVIEPALKVFKINDVYKDINVQFLDMEVNTVWFPNVKMILKYKDYEIKSYIRSGTASWWSGFKFLSVIDTISKETLIYSDDDMDFIMLKDRNINLYKEIRDLIVDMLIYYIDKQDDISHNSNLFTDKIYMSDTK